MTDEKQEELSMEEILSSIRNILMEDNVNQEESKIKTPETAFEEDDITISDASDIQEIEDDIQALSLEDEIFNLSSDMLVDDIEPEINLEAELIDVQTDDEIELPVIDVDFSLEDKVEKIAEQDFNILLDEINIDELADSALDLPEDVVDEELSSAEESDVLIKELETTDILVEEETKEEMSPEEPEEESFDLSLLDDILKAGNEAGSEIEKNLEEEKNTQEQEINVETFPAEFEEIIEVSPLAEEVQNTQKVEDASENMLNSFSKIFANENKTCSNDNSKTFDAEVSKQIKIWLDKNLASIVEEEVKKEISRVMVRAGS